MKKYVIVKCENCGIDVKKQPSKVKETHNFCSTSCSSKFRAKLKVKSTCADCKKEIYVSSFVVNIAVLCLTCRAQHKRDSSKKREISGAKQKYRASKLEKELLKSKSCADCAGEYFSKTAKYCDSCRNKRHIAGGLKAAGSQGRRSKNEALLSEMIIEAFPDLEIIDNSNCFEDNNGGMWDADIIIPELKLAIHWNGIWHYGGPFKSKKLDRSITDNHKYDTIVNNNYTNYIIKDEGNYNIYKVKLEFEKLEKYILAIYN